MCRMRNTGGEIVVFLIVGLGNIGDEYKNTRHNVGFDVIDKISCKYNINVNRIKFKGMYGEGFINNEKVILLKPNTYMNLSGESLVEAVNFYKIPNENIIVIQDDISLPVGKLRIRESGSAGGHNGIKNIILQLSSDIFPRIKIGVGHPESNLIAHVLGKIPKEQKGILEKVYDAGVESVETIIKYGTSEAMNRFNGFIVEELRG